MRKITEIIVHCTATPEGRDYTVSRIREWHVAGNGWKDIGYHWVVYHDGSIHAGRPESEPGAHCAGHNARSIGVCYIGGVATDGKTPKDTRTHAQKRALRTLVAELKERYPQARVYCHNQLNPHKACPSFPISEL